MTGSFHGGLTRRRPRGVVSSNDQDIIAGVELCGYGASCAAAESRVAPIEQVGARRRRIEGALIQSKSGVVAGASPGELAAAKAVAERQCFCREFPAARVGGGEAVLVEVTLGPRIGSEF
jgi:hypothetical protein